MWTHGLFVNGAIDQETRCKHYHKDIDRVAIKFYCCKQYYPCYRCHEESGCGEFKPWPVADFHELAILCGSCGVEQTIANYLKQGDECLHCGKRFNPGCRNHRSLYFTIENE